MPLVSPGTWGLENWEYELIQYTVTAIHTDWLTYKEGLTEYEPERKRERNDRTHIHHTIKTHIQIERNHMKAKAPHFPAKMAMWRQ